MIRLITFAMMLAVLFIAGCVERKLHIESEPSHMLVEINGQELGRTPLDVDFTWYGRYDVVISGEGYKVIKASPDINPQWYEVPPLDLLSYCAPWTYKDHRYLMYKMEKLPTPTEEELYQRATQMKERNQRP